MSEETVEEQYKDLVKIIPNFEWYNLRSLEQPSLLKVVETKTTCGTNDREF